MNDSYDVELKYSRLDDLVPYDSFTFSQDDIADKEKLTEMLATYDPSDVVNFAAQAGVRYSLESLDAYMQSNTLASTISWNPAE